MVDLTWQKSSYCAQGDSCVHVAVAALVRRVRVTHQRQIGWLG
jgi:hypothetical protein